MRESKGLLESKEIESIKSEYIRRFSMVFNSQEEINCYSEPFNECCFNCDVDFSEKKFDGKASFEKSVFVGNVYFNKAVFNDSAYFREVLFLDFQDYLSVNRRAVIEVDFSNVVFNNVALFENIESRNKISFVSAKFQLELSNDIPGESLIYLNSFYKSIFWRECNFSFAIFKGMTSFNSAVFRFNALFFHAIFQEKVEFNADKKNSDEDRTVDISFDKAKFEQKVTYHYRIFQSVSLNNTSFIGLVDFYEVTFKEDVHFYKTDFLDTCVFTKGTFNKKAIFHYSTISNNLILRGANFNGGLNLATINIISNGHINTFDVIIKKFMTASSVQDIDENKES